MKILQIVLLSTLIAASPLSFAGGSSSSASSSSAANVPELDVGVAGVSIGLVLVVTALIRERRKRR